MISAIAQQVPIADIYRGEFPLLSLWLMRLLT